MKNEEKSKIMKNNPLNNRGPVEPCPNCGSKDLQDRNPIAIAIMFMILTILTIGIGILLSFILIGIPIVIGGLIVLCLLPFLPLFMKHIMKCNDCNYKWLPKYKRERMEKKEAKKAAKKENKAS